MIAQRMRHGGVKNEAGDEVLHSAQFVHRLFDEELEKLLSDSNRKDEGNDETLREARRIAEAMVMNEEFDPI
jgi:hypothetical protein